MKTTILKSSMIPLAVVITYALTAFSFHAELPVNQAEKQTEDITGAYFIHGYQVSMSLCYISTVCETGEVLSRDTIRTSFIVNIKAVEGREDSVLFSGLEGADIRIRNANYSGSATNPRCISAINPKDCAYAKRIGDELEFDLLSPFGRYQGRGVLKNGELTLETKFRYRGAGVDYFLQGIKIEDES